MKNKGMSLALETIVILILALTVFTTLTFFFNKQFGQGQTTIELLNGQREACSAYIRQDSKCSQQGYNSVKTSNEGQKTLGKLTFYCGRLQGYTYCRNLCTDNDPAKCTTKAELPCVQECCELYCPAGTKPKPQTGQQPTLKPPT